MKKIIAPFITGFGAGVLYVVPVVKSFSCCFVLPIAAFFALVLDQRARNSFERIPLSKGIVFGLLTGLFAAFFGSMFEILITLITHQNDMISSFNEVQRMIETLPITPDLRNEVLNLLSGVREDLINNGFSWLYTFSILLNNLLVNAVFGMVGGLVGAQIINKRNNNMSENK